MRLLLLLPFILLLSCTQEVDPVVHEAATLSIVPQIELISVQPDSIEALVDAIEFTIKYTDGDGDLGYTSPDSTSISIIDLRKNVEERLHLPLLLQEDTSVAITGIIRVRLPSTVKYGSNASEEVQYAVSIEDRAGHTSNEATSPILIIY